MKIEVKNIKYNPSLSEETNCYSATVYVDDVRAAHARNRGHGGETEIVPINPEGRRLVAKAEAYCRTLAPVNAGVPGLPPVDMDLELFVDGLVDSHLAQQEINKVLKKLDTLAKTAVVVVREKQMQLLRDGKSLNLEYSVYNFRRPLSEVNPTYLMEQVIKIRASLSEDQIIYNDLIALVS